MALTSFRQMFQALRQRYKDVKMKNLKNAKKLRRLKFFSAYVVPAILTGKCLNKQPFKSTLFQHSRLYTLELELYMRRPFNRPYKD